MKTEPSKFPRPKPTELAAIAAAFGPQLDPVSALNRAMPLSVEAVFFCRELPESIEQIVAQFGTDERRREVQRKALKYISAAKKHDSETFDQAMEIHEQSAFLQRDGETYELLLDQPRVPPGSGGQRDRCSEDPARKYLTHHGWEGELKNPQTVLINIRWYWRSLPKFGMTDPDEFLEKRTRHYDGKTVCNLPRSLLDALVRLQKRDRRESKRNSAGKKRAAARQSELSRNVAPRRQRKNSVRRRQNR
jgi:hypothetical protein